MGWKAVLFYAVSYVIETTSFFYWDCPRELCMLDNYADYAVSNMFLNHPIIFLDFHW